MDMAYFEHGGVRIHYEVKGQGEPFFFLHGLGGSIAQVTNTLQGLKGFACIFQDQRGHGDSSLGNEEELSYETLAKDVLLLADHLGIDTPFAVGGISMGAAVSLKVAQLYPEAIKKLVLVRPALKRGRTPQPIPRWYDAFARYLQNRDPNGFFSSAVFAEIQREAPLLAETFKRLSTQEDSLLYPGKYRIIPDLPLVDDMRELERVQTPTLILANHYDKVHAFEYGIELFEVLPHSRFFEVTSKAVDPLAHCREVTMRIQEFLAQDTSV